MFLPDDYPPEWEWRGYNEQLGVAALIQGGGYPAALVEPLRGDAHAGGGWREASRGRCR